MGLFSFTKEIAIDLGTANTIIIHNDKIVIDEPSIVALDSKDRQTDCRRTRGTADARQRTRRHTHRASVT